MLTLDILAVSDTSIMKLHHENPTGTMLEQWPLSECTKHLLRQWRDSIYHICDMFYSFRNGIGFQLCFCTGLRTSSSISHRQAVLIYDTAQDSKRIVLATLLNKHVSYNSLNLVVLQLHHLRKVNQYQPYHRQLYQSSQRV